MRESVYIARVHIAPPAHVTLRSFSTRGFTRAAITIITDLRVSFRGRQMLCKSTPPLPRFRFINFTHLKVPTRDAVSLGDANLRDTKRRLFLFDTTFPLLYTLLIASGVHYAPPPLLNSLPSFLASPLLASLVESRFRSTGLPKRACLRAKSCDRLPYVGVGISFEVSGLIELTSL